MMGWEEGSFCTSHHHHHHQNSSQELLTEREPEMKGISGPEVGCFSEFVEVDPTGRYGRYDEILGKGASKTVYRAFDEYEGIEVAWNQVKLHDFLQSPERLERLYGEIHLLKTLKHDNIMKFYTSWVDNSNRNINFVTELFTSGTLRQYRLKHRTVNIRAVKHWCKQILRGLVYLHSRNPPIIHRDLKCDNIFINGNQGQVKIGDLGLAAILKKSRAAHCVGTPEFMAPEVYEEEYNELVDIYSFGMCVLEMVTFEYPYSECTHTAQIYKKVISGKKPEALYRVLDPEVREFVEKCLATASLRLPAKDLLRDPFLTIDKCGSEMGLPEFYRKFGEVSPILRHSPLYSSPRSWMSPLHDYSSYLSYDREYELDLDVDEFEGRGLDLSRKEDESPAPDIDITIKGRRREDDEIFLRLRIADEEGRIRNIYFPFDIQTDTALSVATEMVSELDMTEQDVEKVADMIDGEIDTLVPGWYMKSRVGEIPLDATANVCYHCASNGSLLDYVYSTNSAAKSLQVLHCSNHGCAPTHGRFEEITYQVEGSEPTDHSKVVPSASSQLHYTDIWAQRNVQELSPPECRDIHCDTSNGQYWDSVHSNGERIIGMDVGTEISTGNNDSAACVSEDYKNEIRQELRWLKAKFQLQLRELTDQQLKLDEKDLSPSSDVLSVAAPLPPTESNKQANDGKTAMENGYREATNGACSPGHVMTAMSFYTSLLPQQLHRATSFPVDAVDL